MRRVTLFVLVSLVSVSSASAARPDRAFLDADFKVNPCEPSGPWAPWAGAAHRRPSSPC